jgi:hypothetical protein
MDSPLFKCKACDHTATQFIPFVYEGWESILHEKKIQQVKPLLGIKRQNTDWATIVLRRLYQNETLKRLLEVKRPSEQSKEPDILEGAVKVYKSREEVDKALKSNLPLSALKLGNNSIHMVTASHNKYICSKFAFMTLRATKSVTSAGVHLSPPPII